VFDFHQVFSGAEEVAEVAQGCRTAGIGCVDCKKILLRNLEPVMEPQRQRREALSRDVSAIDGILEEGAARARAAAAATMETVRPAMGLG
jgi:tryptophanyl-tRNA synthetase